MGERLDTCSSCRFFARHDSSQGACRRRGPVVISISEQNYSTGEQPKMVSMSVWPMIGEEDWCGEYEVRRGNAG